MSDEKKTLKSIHDAVMAAESSIRTARQLLSELLGDDARNTANFSTE